MTDEILYILCKHCDHFIEPTHFDEFDTSEYWHLQDDDQEYNHNATPSKYVATLDVWKWLKADLFYKYPDGHIGPNSEFHVMGERS